MRLLHLLRHAKSSWADPGQPDRERPLAPRGRRAARLVAEHLRSGGGRPELVLCSPALRTMQTLELIRPALDAGVEVLVEEELYGASARQLADRVRRVPDGVRSAMVIGHNPGLQELAVELAREGELRERARAHFPTAALATLVLPDGGWADLRQRAATLVACVAPREL